jgi:hypothetical protein
MKLPLTLVAVVTVALLLSGCASQGQTIPPSSRFLKKRLEIEALQEEVNVAIHNLNALQMDLADVPRDKPVSALKTYHSVYPIGAQERDLDYFIQILRRAKTSLNAEKRRLFDEYDVVYSEME